MEKLDFAETSHLTTITFKEIINWSVLIKFLLDDSILRINNIQKGHELIKTENERTQMEDILRKGMIVKKHLMKPIDTNLLHLYINHTEKYLKPFIQVKYFYDK
jgi:hypothetical protein